MKPCRRYKTIVGTTVKNKWDCIRIDEEIIDIFSFFQNSNQSEIDSLLKFCEEIPTIHKMFLSIKNNKETKEINEIDTYNLWRLL